MADIKNPEKVMPVCGLLWSRGFSDDLFAQLEREIGPVVLRSEIIPFVQTDYYEKEMGDELTRQWCAFGTLVMPDALAGLKQRTNAMEKGYLNDRAGRRVNIDPGLLSPFSLVLASTKNYAHRIYLGQGIYAEVTLIFKHKEFTPLEWTYPDYREGPALDFFARARCLLMEMLARDREEATKE